MSRSHLSLWLGTIPLVLLLWAEPVEAQPPAPRDPPARPATRPVDPGLQPVRRPPPPPTRPKPSWKDPYARRPKPPAPRARAVKRRTPAKRPAYAVPSYESPAVRSALRRRFDLPARPARRWHLRLAVRSTNLLAKHQSLDVLKSDDLIALGEISLEAEYRLLDGLVVGARMAYAGGKFEDSVFGSQTTSLLLHTAHWGVWVGYRFLDAILVFARGEYVSSWARTTLTGSALDFQAWKFASGGYAAGGVEFTIRRRWMKRIFRTWDFTLGLTAELGYLYAGEFRFTGEVDTSRLLDVYTSSLGRLRLDGFCLRTGLVLAF